MPKRIRNGLTLLNTTNESYELLEKLGGGASSTVYRARCIRGRLHGQDVALKEMLEKRKVVHLQESTALHARLRHPNIVKLLSAFDDGSTSYQVLELCERGTLADMVTNSHRGRLTEEQVKGVVHDLVHALLYLRKERVVHRDIKAGNVLVKEDGTVKLADFGLAERLPVDGLATTFCGSPNYVAPEIVRRVPYSFAVDVWSLGCLILTCLNGFPPFEALAIDDVFDNVCNAAYSLPGGTTSEAADMVAALLQVDPRKRMSVNRILAHPFFARTGLVEGLSIHGPAKAAAAALPPPTKAKGTAIAQTHAVLRGRPTTPVNDQAAPLPKPRKAHILLPLKSDDPRRTVSDPMPRRPAQLGAPKSRVFSLADDFAALNVQPRPRPLARGRPPSRAVVSPGLCEPPTPPSPALNEQGLTAEPEPESDPRVPLSLRTALEDYKSVAIAGGRGRRSPSPEESDDNAEPQPYQGRSRYRRLSVDPARRRPRVMLPTPSVSPPPIPSTGQRPRPPSPLPVRHPRMPRSQTPVRFGRRSPSPYQARPSPPPVKNRQRTPSPPAVRTRHRQPSSQGPHDDSMLTILPIGTSRPRPFTTHPLRPQSHRVGLGTLRILPSGELLVDFRDDDSPVMRIRADGTHVRIESSEDADDQGQLWEGPPEDMPRRYWKAWNDASKLVERLKARTPRMVVYDASVKWSRMANEPRADVEGLFIRRSERKGKSKEKPTMRVRYARKSGVVEIARVSHGEWTMSKSVLSDPGRDQEEKAAMEGLRAFVKACELVEDEDGMFCM